MIKLVARLGARLPELVDVFRSREGSDAGIPDLPANDDVWP